MVDAAYGTNFWTCGRADRFWNKSCKQLNMEMENGKCSHLHVIVFSFVLYSKEKEGCKHFAPFSLILFNFSGGMYGHVMHFKLIK